MKKLALLLGPGRLTSVIFALLLLMWFCSTVSAATPEIFDIVPKNIKEGEKITLRGSGFGAKSEVTEQQPKVVLKFVKDGVQSTLELSVADYKDHFIDVFVPKIWGDGKKLEDVELTVTVVAPPPAAGRVLSSIEKIVIEPAEPDLDNRFRFDIKIGLQTSTFDDKDTAASNGETLFHDNVAFYDLGGSFNMWGRREDEEKKKCAGDILANLRIGRKAVQGTDSDPSLSKAVKEAKVVEGTLAPVVSFGGEGKEWYLKPAVGFVATTNAEKDRFYQSRFLGLGFKPKLSDSNPFGGSFIEAGYGYSGWFDTQDRFKGMWQINYQSPDLNVAPFVNVRWDIGGGPDDLTVYYGINLSVKDVFGGIASIFVKKKDEPKKGDAETSGDGQVATPAATPKTMMPML